MHLSQNAWIALAIALGALQCFFGYRAFKIILVVFGFVLAFWAVDTVFHHRVAAFFVGLVSGIVCGALIVDLYLLGVFAASAFFGGALALHLYAVAGQHPEPIMLFIFAAISGLLALFFQKLMIIVTTAFAGAWGVVGGAVWFASGKLNPADILSIEAYFRGSQGYVVAFVWFVLGVAGAWVQFKRPRRANSDYGFDASRDTTPSGATSPDKR